MAKSDRRYWMCIIGPVEKADLPSGADNPPRNAVQEAFEKMLGRRDGTCWSGWGMRESQLQGILDEWSKEAPDAHGEGR